MAGGGVILRAAGNPGPADVRVQGMDQPLMWRIAGRGAVLLSPYPPPVGLRSATSIEELGGGLVRVALSDGAALLLRYSEDSRSLYVRRPVFNATAIIKFFKDQGLVTALPPQELHVTICYSKRPIDWSQFELQEGWLNVVGGHRSMDRLGEALVFKFDSSPLSKRHAEFQSGGASWDFPSYQPHITLSWQAPGDLKLRPWLGNIELGPEIFEEVDPNWKDQVTELAWNEDEHPREPAGSPEGGQFTSGDGGSGGGDGPIWRDGPMPSQSVILNLGSDTVHHRAQVEVLINPTLRDVVSMAKEVRISDRPSDPKDTVLRTFVDQHHNLYVWPATDAIHYAVQRAMAQLGHHIEIDKEVEWTRQEVMSGDIDVTSKVKAGQDNAAQYHSETLADLKTNLDQPKFEWVGDPQPLTFNGPPVTTEAEQAALIEKIPSSRPVLIMACGLTKNLVKQPTPFVDVYAGPLWNQVKKGYPHDSIAVISAEHGILAPGTKITRYDRKMDDDRLVEILNDKQQVDRLAAMIQKAGSALVVGGETYKLLALAVGAMHPELLPKIHFAVGSYLQQRHAIKELLDLLAKNKLNKSWLEQFDARVG